MDSQEGTCCDATNATSLAVAVNNLGFQLGKLLAKEDANVFISPLSISSALAMAFCGARNETAQEMRQVLGYEIASIKNEEVKHCFLHLLSEMEQIKDSCTLTSANIVFSQDGFPLTEDFVQLLEDSFKAMTLNVDFLNESDKAVQQANNWVNEKTNGMISNLLDSLDPATVMVILNAVYFKGVWMLQFDQEDTYEQDFYNNGLEVNAKRVEMMHLKKSFLYTENKSFSAIQLPYVGEEIVMSIFLPKARDGLDKLMTDVSTDFLQAVKSKMRKVKVEVALPKFRLEYSKSLKELFQTLGINRAFSTSANFEGISKAQGLLISDIIHKAVVIVNEEGTEAAAATAVVMVKRCLSMDPQFIADHPFFFLIYNLKTDMTLFMGKVNEL
ncbi:iripin-2 isoform X4 [Parasteatoda tepidariorum]|uniref:iripin-2 isoform X4 n=1 Tax=Parasteatoda tepidariorum TaxID=114398 RepID=UPI001C7225A8|nr:intracellular coagulation inhibitor 2 isoform X4 [Parasteatoda tepidariorum]